MRDRYDYILIDCPPSLGLLTLNTLAAADSVLIPIQCEFYALEGLSQLLNTVTIVQKNLNPALQIEGVLLTMYDGRLNLSRQVADEAKEYFGPKVYRTTIPRNVRIAEAPSFGKPIVLYDMLSVGAKSYLSLAKEVIAHAGEAQARGAEAAARGGGRGGRVADGHPERQAAAGEGARRAAGRLLGRDAAGDRDRRGGAQGAHRRIVANPFQPRREFTPEQLAELEESIRQNGLLQPLVVRAPREGAPDGAEWELVPASGAGARCGGWGGRRCRWWSARSTIAPCWCWPSSRTCSARISRRWKRRRRTSRLIDEFGYTQAEVADSVGRERSTVANLLRLLALPASVQRMVNEGSSPWAMPARCWGWRTSARSRTSRARRRTTGMTRARRGGARSRARRRRAAERRAPPRWVPMWRDDPHVRQLEAELQRMFGTPVRIRLSRGRAGRIEIPFYNADDFDRVTDLMLGTEEADGDVGAPV